jgi:hypothetical protein
MLTGGTVIHKLGVARTEVHGDEDRTNHDLPTLIALELLLLLSSLIVCKFRRDVTICSPQRQCRETLKVSKSPGGTVYPAKLMDQVVKDILPAGISQKHPVQT